MKPTGPMEWHGVKFLPAPLRGRFSDGAARCVGCWFEKGSNSCLEIDCTETIWLRDSPEARAKHIAWRMTT